MKVVVLDKQNFLSDFPSLPIINEWVEYPHTQTSEVLTRLINADIAITSKVVLNDDILCRLPRLKMISTNSTGYDTIDVKACTRLGITLCNVRDWCTNSVAEHVLGFLFALRRHIPAYHNSVVAGEWKMKTSSRFAILFDPAKEIGGSTLGIIGYGTLGRCVAEKARALNIHVLVAERKNATHVRPGYTSFYSVLQKSDAIVLLSPLNDSSFRIIGEKELEMMSPDAVIINCGRGGLIDEDALLKALQNGVIGGAALDVVEQEPLYAGHPLLSYDGNNLLLSPHVAFASRQSIQNSTMQVVENILRFCMGNPQNVVNG